MGLSEPQGFAHRLNRLSKKEVVLSLSRSAHYKEFHLSIVDQKGHAVIYCQDHQKRLETYRQLRAHFKKYHDLEDSQFQTISKIGWRLWGWGKT